jgi:hypothetical protein
MMVLYPLPTILRLSEQCNDSSLWYSYSKEPWLKILSQSTRNSFFGERKCAENEQYQCVKQIFLILHSYYLSLGMGDKYNNHNYVIPMGLKEQHVKYEHYTHNGCWDIYIRINQHSFRQTKYSKLSSPEHGHPQTSAYQNLCTLGLFTSHSSGLLRYRCLNILIGPYDTLLSLENPCWHFPSKNVLSRIVPKVGFLQRFRICIISRVLQIIKCCFQCFILPNVIFFKLAQDLWKVFTFLLPNPSKCKMY